MERLLDFTAGAITLGFLIAGTFFLRFWRDTRDTLFAGFAIAFFLLGVGQALLTFLAVQDEEKSWLYVVRLAAFLCLLLAIARKNRNIR